MSRIKLALIMLSLTPLQLLALPDDKDAKLFIASDHAVYNYKRGYSEFIGHVKIDQGSTHVTAEKLTTRINNNHNIEEAIAYGEHHRAHYSTLPKLNSAPIHAYAKIIKYYPVQANISLLNNVLVEQKNNHFKGSVIHYNMHNETIKVPASANSKATFIYDPDE